MPNIFLVTESRQFLEETVIFDIIFGGPCTKIGGHTGPVNYTPYSFVARPCYIRKDIQRASHTVQPPLTRHKQV